jgi:hypothetical protein
LLRGSDGGGAEAGRPLQRAAATCAQRSRARARRRALAGRCVLWREDFERRADLAVAGWRGRQLAASGCGASAAGGGGLRRPAFLHCS